MTNRCSFCDRRLPPEVVAAIASDAEYKRLMASAEEIRDVSMECRYRWSLVEKHEHNLHVKFEKAKEG